MGLKYILYTYLAMIGGLILLFSGISLLHRAYHIYGLMSFIGLLCMYPFMSYSNTVSDVENEIKSWNKVKGGKGKFVKKQNLQQICKSLCIHWVKA